MPEEDETPCLITVTLGMGSCWEQSTEVSLLLPYSHHFRRVQSDGDFFLYKLVPYSALHTLFHWNLLCGIRVNYIVVQQCF